MNINMEYPKLEELNCSNCTERSIELHYHEFWQYITNNYHHSTNWTERLYWFYHNLTDFPKCKCCGAPTKFINLKNGYREFCSTKCMNTSKDIQDRKKETSRKNWGTDNPMQSTQIKSKHKDTILNKYGVDNVFRLEETKKKIKQTCLEKYGVEHHLQNKKSINKQKNTNIIKYGVECISQRPDYKDKIRKTCLEKYGGIGYESKIINNKIIGTILDKYGVDNISKTENNKKIVSNKLRNNSIEIHENLIGYTEDGNWICKCPNPNCNKCIEKCYITYAGREYDRIKAGLETCTKLLPINSQSSCLENFVHNILKNHNIIYFNNIFGLIDHKELDIYIPNKQIAIECNGCYWHSSLNKPNSYHIQKYNECKKQNIRLISLWEDWIKTKPEIVKSILLNKLGICNNIIYARKTIIKEIDSKVCNDFLDSNHIQGRSAANIRLGLYFGEELVSVMTFSKPRVNMGGKNHKQQWELVRFCNKLNIRVVGGASKLLKYFINTYQPTSIVSFSMNDISDGNLYKILGFETDDKLTHSYWYIDPKTLKRYHRTSFTKSTIVKKGWRDKIDNTWTEKQVMEEQGYFCIYDSGQKKWVLNIE